MIHALETASAEQVKELKNLMENNPVNKIEKVLQIFKDCKVDEWAQQLKEKYLQTALKNLDDVAVLSIRKQPLIELANFMIQRES